MGMFINIRCTIQQPRHQDDHKQNTDLMRPDHFAFIGNDSLGKC